MLELYLRRPFSMAKFRAGPCGRYIDGFAAALSKAGYTQDTGSSCIRHAAHLTVWSGLRGIGIESLDEQVVADFDAHLPKCRCPGQRAGSHERAATRVTIFLDYLRMQGVIPERRPEEAAACPLVDSFCSWMQRHRGVTKATLVVYRRVAKRLVERIGSDPGSYAAGALRGAVVDLARGCGTSKAKQVVTVSRAFVRHLAVEGRCQPGLEAALPQIACWSLASLPRYVSADDVQRIIAACDPSLPGGIRDRAILLLLARIGLRAGDIVGMRLSDIDWGRACVRVAGKGRREVMLPLPQDAGDAVQAYLARRPRVTTDRLFLAARAPFGPLANSSTVSQLVDRTIVRAGVAAPTHGAHLLRHSAATALLREGVSLPAIGAMLRHRSVETTAHYAKVDVEMLRSVAQPWIGGEPC